MVLLQVKGGEQARNFLMVFKSNHRKSCHIPKTFNHHAKFNSMQTWQKESFWLLYNGVNLK